jgi:hypothetical protein
VTASTPCLSEKTPRGWEGREDHKLFKPPRQSQSEPEFLFRQGGPHTLPLGRITVAGGPPARGFSHGNRGLTKPRFRFAVAAIAKPRTRRGEQRANLDVFPSQPSPGRGWGDPSPRRPALCAVQRTLVGATPDFLPACHNVERSSRNGLAKVLKVARDGG